MKVLPSYSGEWHATGHSYPIRKKRIVKEEPVVTDYTIYFAGGFHARVTRRMPQSYEKDWDAWHLEIYGIDTSEIETTFKTLEEAMDAGVARLTSLAEFVLTQLRQKRSRNPEAA